MEFGELLVVLWFLVILGGVVYEWKVPENGKIVIIYNLVFFYFWSGCCLFEIFKANRCLVLVIDVINTVPML